MLDAERSLFLAELDYARNQGDLFQALVNVYKAMGRGWVMQANALAPGPNLDVQANPPMVPKRVLSRLQREATGANSWSTRTQRTRSARTPAPA